MEELMSRISGKIISYPDCIEDIQEIILKTDQGNYHYCIVYLLLLKEQIIKIPETEKDKEVFNDYFERLKAHARKVSGTEWLQMIENAEYSVYKEEKEEENRLDLLINFVMETLIRTSTADMERLVDGYLQEEMNDPRTETKTQINVSLVVIEEVLDNLAKLPEKEARESAKTVSILLTEEHVPLLLKYLGKLSKIILISLYLNNRLVYDALHREFIKTQSLEEMTLLVDFPEIDIDEVIVYLYKNSGILKVLDAIIKTRLIHREKIVNAVIEYIKTGSRTKTIGFIRENLGCFLEIIEKIGLGCEEVLFLAEKESSLLRYAFQMMAEIKSEMTDKKKKPLNLQKKEKRLSNLISALSTELSNGSDEETKEFIMQSHETDPDLLSKVCIGLFRAKQPSDEIRSALSKLVTKKTSTSFVFTAMPYLKDIQKYDLMEEYLVDDVSLTLFTRIIKKPEEILMQAHKLNIQPGKRIIHLCFARPEIFTDRILSMAIEEITKMDTLPALFMETVKNSLKLFSNMKPFLATLIKREWTKLFTNNQAELLALLESVGQAAPEILLTVDESELTKIISKSNLLQKRVKEYLLKQPAYIQNKYKSLLNP
ncbi:hypothetical protein NERG_02405 [Nematocida ausubeli]|uniref:Symplekin C-terminal domain-containing protein n=1 Tax=Nematocida ausubeli (strain ATCC PRA-371 / ERTm2) TaxID=1913371 RepID=H8ZFN4_NEMA1|nr:hypothetical protein NERG_02405 [Nematocida ausubeli]